MKNRKDSKDSIETRLAVLETSIEITLRAIENRLNKMDEKFDKLDDKMTSHFKWTLSFLFVIFSSPVLIELIKTVKLH